MASLLRSNTWFLAFFLAAFAVSGCNFFGKQKDEPENLAVGALANGANILGTWSLSSSSAAADNNPLDAYTESYSFDPVGGAQVRIKDPHKSGIDCIAYGQYRVSGQTVTIYVQAVSASMCGFGNQFILYSVQVDANRTYMQATDASGNSHYRFLAQRQAVTALVGLWDFSGVGGIDFLWFDEYGYFLMQTTDQNTPYLLIGFYQPLATGGLNLIFFTDASFSQVSGTPLTFSYYLTDGLNLQLTNGEGSAAQDYVGTRL